MNLWERREVPRPPEYTVEYSSKELAHSNTGTTCVDLLLDGLQRSHTSLNDVQVSSCVRKEIAILSASLYRNGRHRTEKFYRTLKKVEKSCARWQQLRIVEEIDRLHQLMPQMILERRKLRLPSKQMFEYLLARLLGSYHLMLYLEGICREAAALLMVKISTGHFFNTAVVFLSSVARIRVLAMDFAGQVTKCYDDILPHVQHLKGSKAPPLFDTATLPSSLSHLLQQYTSLLHVSNNSLPANKYSANKRSLDSMNISKEEDRGRPFNVDQFLNSVGENLTNKESVKPKVKEPSDGLDMHVSSIMEEDIGECVPVTKPKKKTKGAKKKITNENDDVVKSSKKRVTNENNESAKGPKKNRNINENSESAKGAKKKRITNENNESAKGAKKRNASENNNNETEDRNTNKATKKTKSEAAVNRSLNTKGKQTNMNEANCSRKKSKQNESQTSLIKTPTEYCSPVFIKHYKKVKKQTKHLNSIGDLSKFYGEEKKSRQDKVKGRASKLLKKEDWREFTTFIDSSIRIIKGLKKVDSVDDAQKLMNKTRIRIKFWLLYPHLKGEKPGNWKNVLNSIGTLS